MNESQWDCDLLFRTDVIILCMQSVRGGEREGESCLHGAWSKCVSSSLLFGSAVRNVDEILYLIFERYNKKKEIFVRYERHNVIPPKNDKWETLMNKPH